MSGRAGRRRPPRPWLAVRLGLAALALLAAACGDDDEQPSTTATPDGATQEGQEDGDELDTTEQLTVDGQTRSYRLFVPGAAAESGPVVVMLHDAGGSPESIAQATQLDRAAREHGFAVAYPASVSGTWNAGFCCGGAPAEGVDDMAFLDELLARLDAHDRVDGEAVYLAGVSNGAVMAYRYACEGEAAVAGVASVAGAMAFDDCDPAGPTSVLEIHGTADEVVPVDGGELADFTQASRPVPSSQELAEQWADLNGCGEATTETEGLVTTTAWPDCDGDAAVRLIVIEGAGHTWYAPGFGEANGAVDATATLVDFFGLGQAR